MLTPFDRWAADLVLNGPVWVLVVGTGIMGWLVSRWCWHWADCLTWDRSAWSGQICPRCGGPLQAASGRVGIFSILWDPVCPNCKAPPSRRWLASIGVASLFAVFAWAVARGECQHLTSGGSIDWIHWRIAYHLALISLLIVATVIDIRVFLIPDSITVTGVVIGIAGATLFGNLQLIPVWIDANQELPGFHGPYIPLWIKQHWHLHGLAWSLAGLVVGGGLTWLVRVVSAAILGREALGFGDVTLMAMIGSFIGWQPVLFVFALAPICGMVLAFCSWLFAGKGYIPYGPYLSAATLLVLLTWRWLWTPLQYIFGHPPTIGALVAGSLAALAVLLTAIRLYRAIPVKRE